MDADTTDEVSAGSSARKAFRRRRYLIEPRFQLKYTAMVVAVAVVVGSVLGFFAYRYSQGQTNLIAVQLVTQGVAPDAAHDLAEFAAAEDANVARAIVLGIALLALVLGVTGVFITHRLVGPAYRIRKLIEAIAQGPIAIRGGLRRHDELVELFHSFQRTVEALRADEEAKLALVDRALAALNASGASSDEARRALEDLRAQIQRRL